MTYLEKLHQLISDKDYYLIQLNKTRAENTNREREEREKVEEEEKRINVFLKEIEKEKGEELLFIVNQNKKLTLNDDCWYIPRNNFYSNYLATEIKLDITDNALTVLDEEGDLRGDISFAMLDADLHDYVFHAKRRKELTERENEEKLFEELKAKLGR